MPSFNDLYKGTNTTTGGAGGVSFNDFFDLDDDEIEKRRREQARQNYIALTQRNAEDANAEVAKNQADKQSLLTKVKRFAGSAAKEAPGRLLEKGRPIAEAVSDLPAEVGERVKSLVSSSNKQPTDIELLKRATEKAKTLPNDIKESAKNLNPGQQIALLKLVDSGAKEAQLRNFLKEARVEKQQADKKMAGAAVEAASYGVGGSSAAKAFTQGGIKAAGKTVAATSLSGTAGGAGYELRTNPEADFGDVAQAAGFGTVFAGATSLGLAGIGAKYNKQKLAQQKAVVASILDEPAVTPITDTAHLLPANTASRTTEVANRLDEINTRLDEIRTGRASTTYNPIIPTADNLGTTRLTTGAPTEVGVTPFRGKGVLKDTTKIAELEGYYKTTRAKGFENAAPKIAQENNVTLASVNRAAGSWEGNLEPSYHIRIDGTLDDNNSWASRMGKLGNQDAVVTFRPGNGASTRYTFRNAKDPEAVLKSLHENGVSGATINGKDVIVYDKLALADGGLTDDLNRSIMSVSKKHGVKPVIANGEGRLITKGEYDGYIKAPQATDRRGVLSDLQTEEVGQGTFAPGRTKAQSVTGAEVRALKKEQRALIAEQKNFERVAPVSQLDDVNRRIAQAQASPSTTPQEAMALKQERDAIRQQIAASAPPEVKQAAEAMDTVFNTTQTTQRYADGEHFAPSSAKNQEARAIANKMAGPEGLDVQPTEVRMSMANEANQAVDLVNSDYTRAKRIALGQEAPPAGVQDTSIMLAVEERATREADSEMINALSQSPIHAELTKGGQRAAALANVNPESPVDLIKTINKIRGKSSNADISSKFVTAEEAKQITSMAAEVAQKREAAIANITDKTTRLEYGRARVILDNYIEVLKGPALKKSVRQLIKEEGYAGTLSKGIVNSFGVFKSILASIDNSAIGRQGWKVFWTSPTTWAKNSVKTFDDIIKTFGGKEVKDALKADIISRPNALNGLYKQAGVEVIDIVEEAFPESLPSRIPGVGRAFKASDAAYTGFVQRSRADLADKYFSIAKRTGVNLADKKQAKSIGHLVNALSGRGKGWNNKALNNLMFSPKLFKSHIDVLTAHQFQRDVTPFVRKQAALNLAKMVGGTAAILAIADRVAPGSVEWDPRSANFGNIKIGNTRFNVTGGMSGFVTLAARLATWETKSSTTGDISPFSADFGRTTGFDAVESFFTNKASPGASIIRDMLKGEDFGGKPFGPGTVLKSTVVPLSVTNYQELKNDPKSANKLVAIIAEGLGISTNTYGSQQKDWRSSKSKEITQFKQSVPEEKFLEANDKFNEQYVAWVEKVSKDPRYNKLSADDRTTVRQNQQDKIRTQVFKDYGFKYKRESNKNLKGF